MALKKETQLRDFRITARITADIAITVKASSLEEALAAGRSLKGSRFATWKGDVYDSSMRIKGVDDDGDL
jgi:hypothetical protein